jgi:hypothetical protein
MVYIAPSFLIASLLLPPHHHTCNDVEMWAEWISEDTAAAVTLRDKGAVMELYKRAQEDYMNVSLYIDYANYVSCLEQEGALDVARGIFEEAVEMAGLHAVEVTTTT